MIPVSNCGFSEWGGVLGDLVVATAPLDRLLHHAGLIRIEGVSHRLRAHADLVPGHVRATARIAPPTAPKRRGRPRKEASDAA